MSKKPITDSETRLFAAVIRQIEASVASGINWDKIAQETGYKDGANAKVMFNRFKKRTIDEGAATADGATKIKPSKKRKVDDQASADTGNNVTTAESSKKVNRKPKKGKDGDQVIKREEANGEEAEKPAEQNEVAKTDDDLEDGEVAV